MLIVSVWETGSPGPFIFCLTFKGVLSLGFYPGPFEPGDRRLGPRGATLIKDCIYKCIAF